MRDYRKIDAWKLADDLTVAIYERTRTFPLHFLCIARGSLSEAQYFLHLSWRLGYLDDAEHASLAALTKNTFACLHGLIVSVEKEAGRLSSTVAKTTSVLALSLAELFPLLSLPR